MRRHLVALLLVPVFIAGMILAAPPATADHAFSDTDPVVPDSEWSGFAGDVTINGTFVATETYECDFGDGVTCTVDNTATTADALTVDIEIDENAAPGERMVTVTQDGEAEPAECADCFTVNGPDEVDPPQAEQGTEELEVKISGPGFDEADPETDSATCDFEDSEDNDDITGDGECEIVDDDGETVVQATISVAEEAEESARDVTVTLSNSDDPPVEIGSGTCAGCFTVTAAQAEPTPTPTPESTPTPTPAPTSDPIDTENVDPEDDDDSDVGGAGESDEDPVLPATGLAGARTFGAAGLGMLGAGLALLGWRRRWTGGGAGTR